MDTFANLQYFQVRTLVDVKSTDRHFPFISSDSKQGVEMNSLKVTPPLLLWFDQFIDDALFSSYNRCKMKHI